MERRGSAGGLSTFSGSSVASSGDEQRPLSTLDVPKHPSKKSSLRRSLTPIGAPQPAAQVPALNMGEPATIGGPTLHPIERSNSTPNEAHRRSSEPVQSPTSSKFFSFLGPHPSSSPPTISPSKGSRQKIHQRSNTTSSVEVKETNTMYKDYDPTTGNKKINKYMLIQEIGRGVHGKVKLGRDVETNELVVSIRSLALLT
jgi:hypothetical protein